MARAVEEIEFVPGETAAVVRRMAELADAGDGWINLLPGVPEDEVEAPPRSVFSALFGSAQPPVSMCTWMPPHRRRRRDGEVTVGIMHSKGKAAVSQLRSLGVVLPDGWRVSQDHSRRGLIVHAPVGVPHGAVLDWALRAGAALAVVPLTGTWKARVHLPAGR